MRSSKRCVKCNSSKVGHLDQLQELVTWEYASRQPYAPQVVGVVETGTGTAQERGVGTLEAYVCTKCGYFETYVKQPDKIPFEQLRGFSWVNSASDGPYR
jgi:hypothetical protein